MSRRHRHRWTRSSAGGGLGDRSPSFEGSSRTARSSTRILAALSLNAFAFAAAQTVVAPVLPAIQAEFQASPAAASFALTSFLVSASVATGVVGRLGDIYGKRRMLLIVMCAFGLGSLIAGTASSLGVLIFGRVVQGLAGAVFPLAFGIVRDELPPQRVAMGLGLVSAIFGIGGGIGLVVAGTIEQAGGLDWVFLVGIPLTAAGVVAAALLIPESRVRTASPVDWVGALIFSISLAALLIAISEAGTWGWLSAPVLGLGAAGALAGGLFLAYEGRVPAPLVEIAMMRDRTVLATNLAAFTTGFGMFGAFLLTPLFVQFPAGTGFGLGVDVTQAGLFLAPSPIAILFAAPVAGALASRIGSRRTLMAGAVIAAVGFAAITLLVDQRAGIYAASVIQGIGIGLSLASMPNLIVGAVAQSKTGIALGINTIMRLAGGALGSAVAVAIFNGSASDPGGTPERWGLLLSFAALAVVTGLGFLVARSIPRRGAGAV